MKSFSMFTLLGVCGLTWSCGTIDPDATISLRTAPNPLDPIGFVRERTAKPVKMEGDSSGAFRVGDYVEVSQDKTPIFTNYPKSGAVPKDTLPMGTTLRVLGLNSSYMNVQTEKGQQGYVSNLMVVPQGLLVGNHPDIADDQFINWSDIADAPMDPEVEFQPGNPDVVSAADQAIMDGATVSENLPVAPDDNLPESTGSVLPESILPTPELPAADLPAAELPVPTEVKEAVEQKVEATVEEQIKEQVKEKVVDAVDEIVAPPAEP